MSIPVPVLPADVLATLAPAVTAIQEQARDAVRRAQLPDLVRKAKTAVRVNGGGSGQYDQGAADALNRAFPGLIDARYASEIRLTDDQQTVAPARSIVDHSAPAQRTCQCASCEVTDCDGDCDTCDDYDCEQCHDECNGGYACCGYCPDHDGHYGEDHGGGSEHVRYSPSRSEPYCRDCDHWCDQYS